MTRARRVSLYLAFGLCVLMLGTPALLAQATTGHLSGVVTADEDATRLPGVTVSAVHEPTSIRYTSVTGGDGRFLMANVRIGGPYRVTANLEGYGPTEVSNVHVNLGATTELVIQLELTEISESIEVVADADPLLSNRTGSTSAVSTEQIENLPTVNRSLQDFARTNPYFNVDSSDASGTRLTVAGRNNRYNTIQIDGAVNNDLFGLADTGTPGGQTDSQPISLDAIEQLQLVVSPYDVRQGGFTGGGINAVTRSGSNEFHGSLFGSQRDQDYIGDGPADRPISEFDQDQYGGRLGGPILKDRLFFFVSGEINRREAPTGVAADGTASTQFREAGQAQQLRDFLTANYGYDPGGLGDFPGVTDSDLALVKLDWTASASNLFTLRHNYVDAVRDVISNRSSSTFRFPTAIYTIADETNSTVAQLNSVLGPNTFNEARIGYQTIRDIRDVPVSFPSVEIGGTGPRRGELHVGTERFSAANALDQDVLELTDDFTWLRGNHTLTFGTHNEFFEFSNLFMSEAFGYYYFPTLEAFEAGIASEYRITFANGADPRRPTQFEVRQYGLYASDTWRVNDRLTLTLGLRGDLPDFVDTPSFNPDVLAAIGHSTAETASEDVVLSPRIGFNWDPTGTGKQQVRGGVGVFAGRTPYVWISNAYGNTGVEQTALSSFGAIPFNPDPFNQPHVGGAGSTVSVDLIDPGFEFPRVLRATLGYDRELPWRLRGTAELLWSQTQEDIFYHNVNRLQVGTSPLDGRPTFAQVDTATVRDAILLTNTGRGEEMVASLQLSRPLTRGVTLSGAYAYMDAESAMDGGSSRAISNWQFRPTPGDIFQDDVATSLFEVRHRFNLAASYAFDTGPVGHSVGLYYNVQSGRPYSLLVGGDPNRDGYTSNDLLFVPGAADAIILQNSSGTVIPYEVFADFLRSAGVDPTAGAILSRNGSREPWSRLLDFHYDVGLPIRRVDTRVSLDIFNLLNLIDSDEGVVDFVNFQTYTPVTYRGQDAATGKPIYRESFNGALEPGRQFSLADTRSRWQARLGLRLTF